MAYLESSEAGGLSSRSFIVMVSAFKFAIERNEVEQTISFLRVLMLHL
jgi:hypothetical protein